MRIHFFCVEYNERIENKTLLCYNNEMKSVLYIKAEFKGVLLLERQKEKAIFFEKTGREV